MRVISISAVVVALAAFLVWLVCTASDTSEPENIVTQPNISGVSRPQADGPVAARRPANFADLFRQSYEQLPNSSNADALRAEENARG